METASDRDDHELDPQSQLAMLATVQDAAEAEAWMPPTPIWHAPVLATAFAGLYLINTDRAGLADLGAVVGFLAVGIAIVDQIRRQRVVPRRLSKPRRALGFYGFMAAVALGLALLWSRIELPSGSTKATLVLFGAWPTTTAILIFGIATTNRLSGRWTASSR